MPAKTAQTTSPLVNKKGPLSTMSNMAHMMYNTCVTARNLEPLVVDMPRNKAKSPPKRQVNNLDHHEFASVKMGWRKVLKGLNSQPV